LTKISSKTCMPCQSPCKTCTNYPNSCDTCLDGFKRINWKCQKLIHINFTIVLVQNVSQVIGAYDNIIQALLQLVRKPQDQT